MQEKKIRQKAVGIKYNPIDTAPKVVAKGAGIIADKIIEKGQTSDVPVFQDAKLTEELTRLDLGVYIPPELYDVVAQVLIFISDLDKKESLKNAPKQS
jgi:flagellar biosynthesis protein